MPEIPNTLGDTSSATVPSFTGELPPLRDEYGREYEANESDRQVIAQLFDQNEELQNLKKKLEKAGENDENIQAQIDRLQEEILNQAIADGQILQEQIAAQNEAAQMSLMSWDPRLARIDSFLMKNGQGSYVVPFSSMTAASSFMDMVFVAEAEVTKYFAQQAKVQVTDTSTIVENSGWSTLDASANAEIAATTKVPLNHESYEDNSKYYGTASLMNPYSITKLMGSLEGITKDSSNGLVVPGNFIYDVRDQRRFYDAPAVKDTDYEAAGGGSVHFVTTPTIRNIIHWSNLDKWGRTPYQYQDFVYCTYAGIIPNNRLITLRRYPAPVYDNISFEGMLDSDQPGRTNKTKYFGPRCTMVTYFGGESGNSIADILKYTTGIPWEDAESDIWDVTGEMGDDPQGKIDEMFANGGFDGSQHTLVGKLINGANIVTGKILSFGKMVAATNTKFGMSQDAFKNVSSANIDPYKEGSFKNRIQGPLNRIKSVKKRQAGIIFEQGFTLKFSYTAKSIGGINPKAALLDIMGNCLEMVSADALFWGGGHRFMIEPKLYPYHDGGWRDSFMKKLYDGKIFGKGGAMDFALQGIKNFAQKDANGKETGDIWGNIQSHMGSILGTSLACIGTLITNAASALFGESSGSTLQGLFNKGIEALGGNADEKNSKAKTMVSNLLGNLNTMWHNKVLASTMVPRLHGMNSLLIGEPVGEWHLTIGNPLNPIMVVGNLVCEKMDVQFGEELGPDDFPLRMDVTYTLHHGMPRDKSAIQSMFNKGMGKYYELPDYIKSTSDFETKVDHYTGGTAFRQPYFGNSLSITMKQMRQNGYGKISTFQNVKVDPGSEPTNHGNPNTQLITKFTPPPLTDGADIVTGPGMPVQSGMLPNIRSLGITRKYTN